MNKLFKVIIAIGVILLTISIGMWVTCFSLVKYHEDDIIVHKGEVYDYFAVEHFVMDRHSGTEYDKTLFVALDDTKALISVHQTTDESHAFKPGERVTVYEYDGKYALVKSDLFMSWYSSHVAMVFFCAGFLMISMPLYFYFHSND